MNFLIKPRRGGKTRFILEQMKDRPNSVCVCFSKASATAMLRMAQHEFPGASWSEEQFITPNRAANGRLLGTDEDVYVDNADLVFAAMFGREPHLITFTGLR